MHDETWDPIIAAAMALAADKPWHEVTLGEIAAAAGTDLSGLYRLGVSKPRILWAVSHRADLAMLATPPDAGDTARDQVFELIMRRFEALAPYRTGLASVARSLKAGRLEALVGGLAVPRGLKWLLTAAGQSTSGFSGRQRLRVLGALYLSVLPSFLSDDSPDLAKTMAALDKALGRAMPWLRLNAPKSAPAAAADAA